MSTLNISGLTKAAPKKAKVEKPILPDPTGVLTRLVVQGIEHKQHIAAREAPLKQGNEELGAAAFQHAAVLYAGRAANIEDTFQIGTAAGKALVSLKNAYKLPEDLGDVRASLGEHATILRDSFTIEVDADAIPSQMQQVFIDELVKLARALDALLGTDEGGDGAVFHAITVKQRTSVEKSFHEARWALFTPAQNAALQRAMPCIISIKYDY